MAKTAIVLTTIFLLNLLYNYSGINNVAITEHIDLKPETTFEFDNPLFWSATATCTVATDDDSDLVSAKMLKGTATVNG